MTLFRFREPTAGVQSDDAWSDGSNYRDTHQNKARAGSESPPGALTEVWIDIARRFAHLADLDNDVFDRLGRYEAALWRQVRQTLFTLERLRWRGPSARSWRTKHSWPHTIRPQLGDDQSDPR